MGVPVGVPYPSGGRNPEMNTKRGSDPLRLAYTEGLSRRGSEG